MKKIIAILMCLALVLSFAACTADNKETTTNSDTTVADTTVADTTEATSENATAEVTSDTTSAIEPEPATEATTAEITTETTTEATTETTTAKTEKAPSTKAEIVALYNDATAQVKAEKPGYKKLVNTQVKNLQMGALAKIKIVRTTIADFLGEGTTSYNVSKGKFSGKDLKVSTLAEGDVSDATCKLSSDGKYYEITITVKNEKNLSKKSSSLGKFTADYKDAEEIRQGLVDADASVGTINYWTTSVVIKAKISVDGHKFDSLSHTLRMSAELFDVKYSIAKVSKATTDLATDVTYSSFNY